jgi:cell fate regulator YaaT (PSP1 superfamily)
MPECIGVKFDNGPKIHYLEAPPSAPAIGSRCVVVTRRGLELGKVRTGVKVVDKPQGHFVRDAQSEDLKAHDDLRQKAEDLKWLLRARARQAESDVKIVALEFTIDESLLVVSYSSEKPVPLRVLAQELIAHTSAKIEFANVGPRDQARMLGALGVCGDGTCSSTWLQSFNAVSIRMARDQQLPLNPEKISGPCGRLMCCLQFEHDMYRELLKGMPRKGAKACHDGSGTCGRVVKLNPLKGTVELKTDEGVVEEFPADELKRVKGGGN